MSGRSAAAERDWLDTLSAIDLQAARQVQRALDASVHGRLPEPEVTESDWGDLMPMERALFQPFADTVALGVAS